MNIATFRIAPYLVEIRYEVLSLSRTARYAVPTILIPLLFYVFFGLLMNHGPNTGLQTLLSMATFGVMGAAVWGIGASVAAERGLGWLLLKRASPMPPSAYFIAKLVSASIFGAAVLAPMFLMASIWGGVHLAPFAWLRLGVTLLAGALPFCALAFALGTIAKPSSAPGVLNLVILPMSFLSGLWIPLEFLPQALRQVAHASPAYHLVHLANAAVGLPTDLPAGSYAESLTAFLVVFTGIALLLWRRDRVKAYG